jgi:phosphopantothenoylcysteine decarboxylase / phosphopantothenate---cysteine ligase
VTEVEMLADDRPAGHTGDHEGPHKPVVVLGVTGGIAAYKAVEVCRRLVDAGMHVVPVMTEDATRFVGEVTLSALASEPLRRSLWDDEDPIPHTTLGRRAELVLVAPATARFLATYATGLADGLLGATLLATRAPVLVCPAMHTEMWEHPAVQENLATLRRRGVHVVEPSEGRLAGGDIGSGRLAEPEEIVARVLELLAPASDRDLLGRTVLVTAGGTREAIDPVRYITNRSSGKQGHAVASAAVRRGATVVLITTTSLEGPPGSTIVRVDSAAAMEQAVREHAPGADVIVMAAAVADFRPKVVAERKLSKADGLPEIVLEPTPDILRELARRRRPGQVVVGFAAETDHVVERARAKLASKGLDVIVANDVGAPGAGFDHDTNAATILVADGSRREVPLASKAVVADAVLDTVVSCLGPGTPRAEEP